MNIHMRDRRCITILLPSGAGIGSGAVRLLVRYAQRRCGASPWGSIAVEQFSGGADTETLLIAHPAEPLEVTLADDTLMFIHNYFMD